MNKILTMSLAAVGLVLASQHQAMAWSKFNFGVGLNLGWEGGGNNYLWGMIRGANTPGAGVGAYGPGPGHGPGPGMAPYGPGLPPGGMMDPNAYGPSPYGAALPFPGPAAYGQNPALAGSPYPAPGFDGASPFGGFGQGFGGFGDPNFAGPNGFMPGAPGIQAAPAPIPKTMPSAGPSVAQPVGYFPYADPAVGYYPGYPNYNSNSYYGRYAR